MVTLDEVKAYLGVDFEEDDGLLGGMLLAAGAYLTGTLGRGYPEDDARVRQLELLVVADLYNSRELTGKAGANVRRLAEDFSLQLRLEMRNDVPAGDRADSG